MWSVSICEYVILILLLPYNQIKETKPYTVCMCYIIKYFIITIININK